MDIWRQSNTIEIQYHNNFKVLKRDIYCRVPDINSSFIISLNGFLSYAT